MKIPQHVKQRLATPTYRTKLFVFAVIGIALILLALHFPNEFWREIFLEFSVTFLAVFLIQASWDLMGGDLSETKIDVIQSSLNLLADFDKNGIERVWPNRKAWQEDKDAGLKNWRDWLCQANEVCIVSNTFWNNWLKSGPDDTFLDRFARNIERGASVRMLLYHPNSYVQRLRRQDEPQDPQSEMQGEIVASLTLLAEKWKNLEETAKQRLKIRLTYKSLHYVQLIRGDNRMLLNLYLSGKSGSPSPTIQLHGPESAYFITYNEQFEILWKRGMPLELTSIPHSVTGFTKIPPPPIDDFDFPKKWVNAFEEISSQTIL